MKTRPKMLIKILTTISICSIITSTMAQTTPYTMKSLKPVAQWGEMEFSFPSEFAKSQSIANGNYVPGNSIPLDVDIDYKENTGSRILVTFPRFRKGVPMTIGYVSQKSGVRGPLIEPYPNFQMQNNGNANQATKNCNAITSVFRVTVDECQRIWILDTGMIGSDRMCPPQLWIYDLNTDNLIHRYTFPLNQYTPGSLFITITLDVVNCRNTMAYISDVTGNALIVYDLNRGKSWKITNRLFHPDPDYGVFTISNESFDLMDGILALALSPKSNSSPNNLYSNHYQSNNRVLYFHALASGQENMVATSILNNNTIWEADSGASPRSFMPLGVRGQQSAAQAMDRNGNLFFGLLPSNAIGCWNINNRYDNSNIEIVAQNSETLQFASGVKIVTNRKGKEELWVLTCRFQRVMTGSMNPAETNFRIQAIQVEELLNSPMCGGSSKRGVSNVIFPNYGKK
uniref:Putative yellow-related salivary protein n=1 Tax=Corethrella appendiculata TaxID=1370023 RepID=U5EV41_9DIPT